MKSNYTIKEKSELIALLELDHHKQAKLFKDKIDDKRFLLLLDLLKDLKFDKKIIQKIR